MRTNIFAGFFVWLRSVIEEADKPLSLLLTILLPFIAPIIPSIITANNLQKYMDYSQPQAYLAAVAFALVGYVSMVTAIGAIMNFVEMEHNQRVWLPVVISTGSYLVYVLALVMVNVILERTHGVEMTKVSVTALMTLGLEIPSSLLNGTRISNRNIADEKHKEVVETRAYKLEKLRIVRGSTSPQPQSQRPQTSPRETSNLKAEVYSRLDEVYKRDKRVLTASELTSLGFDKSTAWRHRNSWLEEHKK